MQQDSSVTRRIDQMLLLLGRRPKLPLSPANVFLVSCVDPCQVRICYRINGIARLLQIILYTLFIRLTSAVFEAGNNVAELISLSRARLLTYRLKSGADKWQY